MKFKLFACCLPVQGARRSIICDVQRGSFKFIPNILFEILTEHKDKTVHEIKGVYGQPNSDFIDQYFQFLIENDFGFWCENPCEFPDLGLDWKHPSIVTNAIVDVNAQSSHDFERIQLELDILGCQALHLRMFDVIDEVQLENILLKFNDCRLRSIDLILKYSDALSIEYLTDILQKMQRIRSLVVHSSPCSDKHVAYGIKTPIIYTTEAITDHRHCGVVDPTYFVVNIAHFTESLHFNNCLNRKVGIDVNGYIKNCPSMSTRFGNIRDTSLLDAIAHRDFKRFWNITKDQIEICSDCEFRYICTDCRAYTDGTGDHAKPSKCAYDPYAAAWVT